MHIEIDNQNYPVVMIPPLEGVDDPVALVVVGYEIKNDIFPLFNLPTEKIVAKFYTEEIKRRGIKYNQVRYFEYFYYDSPGLQPGERIAELIFLLHEKLIRDFLIVNEFSTLKRAFFSVKEAKHLCDYFKLYKDLPIESNVILNPTWSK